MNREANIAVKVLADTNNKKNKNYDDEKKEKYPDYGTDDGRRKHDVVYATDNLRD